MATKTTVVNVGTSAVRLDVAEDLDYPGQLATYYNAGSVDVWLGDSAVTVGNGIKLAPGGSATEAIPPGSRRYGIASATCQVNVDQVGV